MLDSGTPRGATQNESHNMKIRIPAQTVEVDEKLWALSYGLDPSEVRADVISHFSNAQSEIVAEGYEAAKEAE